MIKKILEKLSCKHKWYTYNETETYSSFTCGSIKNEIPIKHKHTLICKKCGKIKKIIL